MPAILSRNHLLLQWLDIPTSITSPSISVLVLTVSQALSRHYKMKDVQITRHTFFDFDFDFEESKEVFS